MAKSFLTMTTTAGLTVVREVNFLPETTQTPNQLRIQALRWIEECGNDQHRTTLTLVHVVTVRAADEIAAYSALAALGAH